ncbi:MAG: hypothetical protein AMXMBFR82_06870 [Candidatus Hydrogenedentota bacterium]
MSNQDGKSSRDFASNLFEFLEEEETLGSLADLKEELQASGIDPEVETRWATEYAGEQIRMLKTRRIQAASETRNALLNQLKTLRTRGSAGVVAVVDRLLSQFQCGQLQGLEAIQAQFSKLENPTEADLRSLLEDWVEIEKWGDSTESDKE